MVLIGLGQVENTNWWSLRKLSDAISDSSFGSIENGNRNWDECGRNTDRSSVTVISQSLIETSPCGWTTNLWY